MKYYPCLLARPKLHNHFLMNKMSGIIKPTDELRTDQNHSEIVAKLVNNRGVKL